MSRRPDRLYFARSDVNLTKICLFPPTQREKSFLPSAHAEGLKAHIFRLTVHLSGPGLSSRRCSATANLPPSLFVSPFSIFIHYTPTSVFFPLACFSSLLNEICCSPAALYIYNHSVTAGWILWFFDLFPLQNDRCCQCLHLFHIYI